MFDSLRDRVRDLRNEQDDCALKKAEAAVVYAVSVALARLSIII
jgi:hypothetical protein